MDIKSSLFSSMFSLYPPRSGCHSARPPWSSSARREILDGANRSPGFFIYPLLNLPRQV
jgi:hypothetical protein